MADKQALVSELSGIVGDMYVVHEPEDLIVFESDGSVDRALPPAVVLPKSTEQVPEVVKAARRDDVPIVARGAGHSDDHFSEASQYRPLDRESWI